MKILPGEFAPWFQAPVPGGIKEFQFSSLGGMHVLLLFVKSADSPLARQALADLHARRAMLDDRRLCFFGITRDPADVGAGRAAISLPGIRWFTDFDGSIAQRFGAIDAIDEARPIWMAMDPLMRIMGRSDVANGGALLDRMAEVVGRPRVEIPAPVLILPDVFDRAFCRRLIDAYDQSGGEPSGFMRTVEGKTVGVFDEKIKRRRDHHVEDPALREQIQLRLTRFLIPMVKRALQFEVTRVERYMVACYDGESAGFFRAHRDNTTAGTAHRRFACTINLNAEDYEGGNLLFPEFGTRSYRAPTGAALVFSCSLLHEAQPVTKGRRYAFLPFFYDEAAAREREAMARSGQVASDLAKYRVRQSGQGRN